MDLASRVVSPESVSSKPVKAVSIARQHGHHLTEFQRVRNNFLSGGLALSCAYALVHPLDTFKTQQQATAGVRKLNLTFSRETMRILGKGFFTSILGAAPQGGLRLATYEFVRSHLSKTHPTPYDSIPQLNPMMSSAISAVCGDTVSSIIKVPREVITARLQTAHLVSSVPGHKVTTLSIVNHIMHTEGPAGFFRGFWSTTLRDWPFMVILFTTYESFKQIHTSIPPYYALSEGYDDDDDIPIPTLKSTLFGGLSGALAGFCTTPFDMIKTKVMTATKAQAGGRVRMWQVAAQILEQRRAELAKAGVSPRGLVGRLKAYDVFFTGATARSTWWMLVIGAFFPIYERTKEALRDMSD
ncbi:mitochondrial carrier domain-containing protein [Polychytrium aggregatum]|uniref:mitochondrial carrier domain-containing protein n=1 Tax=Polychytrium aggregatum TaxID=110093 RepID=UPI0022FE92A1|nr:mitochondrial carrier domain-containing protein [Polychytrium aggregatum]KAI9206149.1 mitochondrial carrier domain-containing protein [Polychytrium aggregatum]